jgi:rRNA-processing protein FCF1
MFGEWYSMKILLDTNFLLLPVQFKVDIYEMLKNDDLFTLGLCINEIKRLSEKKSKDGISAKVALKLLNERNVKILETTIKRTDSAIIEIAKKHNYIVATNDKALIKTLKRCGVKIVRLKQKKYLTYE